MKVNYFIHIIDDEIEDDFEYGSNSILIDQI
jgi:hypothetical protein